MGEGLQASLFIGILITEHLQEKLDSCEPHQERYFKRNDPEFLQVTTSDGKSYIGKRFGKKIDFEKIDDVVLNIISILKKVCPENSFEKKQFTVFTEISIG